MNDVICTNANCIAVSHARRFGKSHAAGMIDAYYSRGCDSYELFKVSVATKRKRKHIFRMSLESGKNNRIWL